MNRSARRDVLQTSSGRCPGWICDGGMDQYIRVHYGHDGWTFQFKTDGRPRMRCPQCQADNEEGVALCAACDAPLTFYAKQWTGEVSLAARERARKLTTRPPAVAILTVADLLLAVFGPLG